MIKMAEFYKIWKRHLTSVEEQSGRPMKLSLEGQMFNLYNASNIHEYLLELRQVRDSNLKVSLFFKVSLFSVKNW